VTIVELAGPPGAGKSTSLPAVLRACSRSGLRTYTVEEAARVFAARTVLGRLTRRLPRPLHRRVLWAIYRVSSTFAAARFFAERPALARYLVATHRRRPPASDARRRRTVYWYVRSAGDHAFLRSHGRPEEAVVVDEGLIHRALQLHASSVERPDRDQIERYLDLIPEPDLLVVVNAPRGLCRSRVRERGTWRRLAHRRPEEIDRFVDNAHRTLELMTAAARTADLPRIEVDNSGDLDATQHTLGRHLEDVLRDRATEQVTRLPRPHLRLLRARPTIDRLAPTRHAASIDAPTCAAVLARYGLGTRDLPRDTPSGRRNSSVVVRTPEGQVVLRRYRQITPLATVRHEHAVLQELRRRHFPTVEVLTNQAGRTVTRFDGHTYAAFRFVTGAVNLASCCLPRRRDPRVLEAVGRALGRTHLLLEDFVPASVHHLEHTGPDRTGARELDWHLEALTRLVDLPAVGIGVTNRAGTSVLAGQQEHIAARVTRLHRVLEEADLPRTVIHGDYGLHNILLRRDGTLVVHDFELARRAWRLIDLVIVLARHPGSAGRDILAGYDSQIRRTDDERRLIPEVWEYYHLTGAIRSWDNYARHGGSGRLSAASQRLSLATQARPGGWAI
jgi:Ser/Thr protein kinase RdoA (MazF antagonist)